MTFELEIWEYVGQGIANDFPSSHNIPLVKTNNYSIQLRRWWLILFDVSTE